MIKTVCLCAAALWPGMASAQMLSAGDPQSFVTAMQDMGFRASFEPADNGRPRIRSSVSRVNYSIWFYGCTNEMTDCRQLLMSAGFDLADGTDFESVNEWNAGTLNGRVYLDDEMDPFLEMSVLHADQIGPDVFERILDIWDGRIVDFTDAIGFKR